MTPRPPAPADADLVRSALAGDTEAQGQLVDRHLGLVFTVAFARMRDRETAEDLTQEVFVRALSHLDQLKPDPSLNLPAWLSRITRNLSLKWIEREQRRSRLVPMVPIESEAHALADDEQERADVIMENRERDQMILRAMENLAPEQREVVMLHFAQGLRKREIAQQLGVHPSTVGRSLRRALKALRREFEAMSREASAALRPSERFRQRTLSITAAMGAMTAAEKASLAASATVGSLGGVSAAGPLLSLMGKVGTVSLTGKTAVIGTVIAVAAIGTAIIATKNNPPLSAPVALVASDESEPTSPEPEVVNDTSELASEEQTPDAAPEISVVPTLSKFSRHWGRVTDTHGNPIAEALVYITESELMANEPLLLTQTDFEGRFEFINAYVEEAIMERAMPGSHTFLGRLVAEAPGRARATCAISVRANGEREYDLELAAAGTLSGEVFWDTGEPVTNAEVTAVTPVEEDAASPPIFWTLDAALADAWGRFRLDHLAPGQVTLAARPVGGQWIVAGDYEVGAEGITATITRPPGVITGQLLGAFSREPVASREIRMGAVSSTLHRICGRDAWVTLTDSDGRFRFENVPVGPSFSIHDATTDELLEHLHIPDQQSRLDVTLLLREATHVAGRVINCVTDEPVAGITMNLIALDPWSDVQATSDAEGWIDFGETGIESQMDDITGAPRHSVPLDLAAEGWLFPPDPQLFRGSHSAGITLRVDRPEDLSNLQIMVDPCEEIAVRVVDPDGQPLAGANLTMACDSSEHEMRLEGSDPHGCTRALLPASVSRFQIRGIHEDWPLIVSPVFTHASREVVARAVPLTSVIATVVDTEGNPLSGMHVIAQDHTPILGGYRSSFSPSSDYPTTGEDGTVVIEGLSRSPHLFVAACSEEEMRETSYTGLPQARLDLTDAPELAEVMIVRVFGTHHGYIRSGITGEPIAGAEVRWDMDERSIEPTHTGSDGHFELRGVPGVWNAGMIMSADGYAAQRVNHVSLHMQSGYLYGYFLNPAITLMGQVRRPDGSVPVPSPLYLFIPVEDPWGPQWDVVPVWDFDDDQQTHEDGTFSWTPAHLHLDEPVENLPAWLLVLTDEGETATADCWLDLTGPQVIDLGELTLLPGATLNALVLNADGQPMEGARVEWENIGEIDPIMSGSRRLLGGRRPFAPSATWRARTDEAGMCELVALPRGHWRFAVRKEGRRPEVFELDVMGDMEHTFTLSQDASMELVVRVTGFDGEPMRGVEVSMDRSDPFHNSNRVPTGADGSARFTDFPPGDWRLMFNFDWQSEAIPRLYRLTTTLTVPPEGCVMDVDMTEWGAATGLVTQGGHPSPEALITANQCIDGEMTNTLGQVWANDQGIYNFPLPPGNHILISAVGSHEIEIGLGEVIEVNLGE